MKKMWRSFNLRERLCLLGGAAGSIAILCLLLLNRDSLVTVIPYVLLIGGVEGVCFGGLLWDRDRKRAFVSLILIPLACIVMAVMFLTGRL